MKTGSSYCQQVHLPRVTPEMQSYSHTQYTLWFVDILYFLAALLIILHAGMSAKLRNIVEPLVKNLFLKVVFYYALLVALIFLIEFPLTFYQSYWLEHQYGLSHQSLAAWLIHIGKAQMVRIVINGPIYAFLLWLFDKKPKRWAVWLWAASIPVIAAGIFLEPLVIDPLFNKFTPMTSGALYEPIEQLAARAGIPNAPIFIVDKSKDTGKINAYVTGIGTSARIVIWDNTLHDMPADQVLAVVGHELGHYVLLHIYKGFAMSVIALFPLLMAAQWLAPRLVAKLPATWGIRGLDDFAIIPVIAIVITVVGFFAEPVSNGISRYMEHEADAYGLEITHNGPAMARAFVTLSEQNLSEPDPPPFIEFWFFSHPSLRQRIEFACRHQN